MACTVALSHITLTCYFFLSNCQTTWQSLRNPIHGLLPSTVLSCVRNLWASPGLTKVLKEGLHACAGVAGGIAG